MTAWERWTALVAPPLPPPAPVDWAALHRDLGTELPRDYRAYVDTYGLGCVGRLYWVLHPYGTPDQLDLGRSWAWAREPQPLETPPPLPLGRVPGGLLPCAVDEDAGVLYWDARPSDPDRWTVVSRDEDGGSWMPFPLGLVEFLLAVFTGGLPELHHAEAGFLAGVPRFEHDPFA